MTVVVIERKEVCMRECVSESVSECVCVSVSLCLCVFVCVSVVLIERTEV